MARGRRTSWHRPVAEIAGPLAFVAALAACGGSPHGPSGAATGSTGAPGNGGGEATFGDESFRGPMKPLAPTSMVSDLRSYGLDPAALPPLDQLPPETLRKVMGTFTRSLGARCEDCHIAGDYGGSTPRKQIALGMWNHFVRQLSRKDGTPVYCDSCHQGKMTPLLDRHDPKALGRWMDANFVAAVARRDGKVQDCPSCHGDPFQSHFLKTWASAPTSK